MARRDRIQKVMYYVATISAIVGLVVGAFISSFAAKRQTVANETILKEEQKKLESENGVLKKQIEDAGLNVREAVSASWETVLVNEANPLDTAYLPELVDIQDTAQIDARIAEQADRMFADAKAAGLNLVIVSGYRSPEDQKKVFNDSVQDRLDSGMSYYDAFTDTKKSVACPGCSEQATGLAMDIISGEFPELDDRQASTAEAQWLAKNCQNYGFILRYPPEKADITGIIYEPWHYRYVGVDVAKEIMSQEITLEEYYGQK